MIGTSDRGWTSCGMASATALAYAGRSTLNRGVARRRPRAAASRRASGERLAERGDDVVSRLTVAGLADRRSAQCRPCVLRAALGWEWLTHGVVELRGVAGKLGTRSRQVCPLSVDLVALVVEHAGNHLRERSLASGLPANPQPQCNLMSAGELGAARQFP